MGGAVVGGLGLAMLLDVDVRTAPDGAVFGLGWLTEGVLFLALGVGMIWRRRIVRRRSAATAAR
jgi:hypothetical protein